MLAVDLPAKEVVDALTALRIPRSDGGSEDEDPLRTVETPAFRRAGGQWFYACGNRIDMPAYLELLRDDRVIPWSYGADGIIVTYRNEYSTGFVVLELWGGQWREPRRNAETWQ